MSNLSDLVAKAEALAKELKQIQEEIDKEKKSLKNMPIGVLCELAFVRTVIDLLRRDYRVGLREDEDNVRVFELKDNNRLGQSNFSSLSTADEFYEFVKVI